MARHQEPPQPPDGGDDQFVDNRAVASGDEASSRSIGSAPEQLATELESTREQAQAMLARYQRLAADFENHKRRTHKELADRTQYANEELLRKLLPLLDSFRRALAHAPEGLDRGWFDGIKLIARQFEDTLEAQGVSVIPALGEKFDPAQHEAIAREETDQAEEGTVLEEMQPGYRLHNRVIRPTLVKVAQPKALNK